MTSITPADFCKQHTACEEGTAFACQFTSMADVWNACDNVNWLFWILDKHNVQYNKQKLAAKFVREIWHLLKDDRSKRAIEAIETDTLTYEIKQGASAAYAAAYAADAAAADAAAAAADAADAAAYAAAYAATATARKQMKQKQCEIIKAFIPNPFT